MCRCGVWRALCCCRHGAPVVSDSARPQRRQPTGLPRPWDSPGKSTGVGCHFLLQCVQEESESESEVVSDSSRPHGPQPTRLLRPWDFPGESTGVGAIAFSRQALQSHENSYPFLSLYRRTTRFKKAKWIPKAWGAKTPLALKDTKSYCRKCVLTRG